MRGKITKKLLQQKFLPAKFCYLCLRLISSRCILQNARPKLSRKKTVCIARVRVTQFSSLKAFQPFIFIVIRLDVRRLQMNGLDFKPVIQPLHNPS